MYFSTARRINVVRGLQRRHQLRDNTANPLDTGTATQRGAGIFKHVQPGIQYATGQYRYKNVEWYVQDNWKATSRLTFDYGLRFYYIEPQHDARTRHRRSCPGCGTGLGPASLPARDHQRHASGVDPVTAPLVAATSSAARPELRDLLNGIRKAATA